MYLVFSSVSKTAGYSKQYVPWFCDFRLQEKLTNLENENHVLRQKAFNTPTMNNLAVAPKTLSEKFAASTGLPKCESKSTFESPTPTKYLAPLTQTLTGSRRSRLPVERHEVDLSVVDFQI